MKIARGSRPNRLQSAASRLHSLAIHLLRRVRRVDVATGLGPARLSALSVLVFGGPRTLGQLAAAEQVRPPSMSRLVAALEAEGIVSRRPHPEDARAVVLRATAKGRRILEAGRDRRVEELSELLVSLSDRELRIVEEAVGLLESCLEQLAPKPRT